MILTYGIVNVLAWIFRWDGVLQLHASFRPAQFNSALMFSMLGASLLLHPRRPTLVRIGSLLVTLLASLIFLQYATGFDLQVDQFFLRSHISANPVYPGRIAANTAVCFILSGLGLWFLSRRSSDRLELITMFLGVSIAAFASLAIFGFSSTGAGQYGWGNLTSMSPPTAVCFILLGIDFTLQAFNILLRRGVDRRATLPIFVSLGVLISTILFWQASLHHDTEEVRKATLAEAISVRAQITQALEDRMLSIERMARRLEAMPAMSESMWQADAAMHIRHLGVLEVMSVITPDKRLRWVVPLEENRHFVGADLSKDPFRNRYLDEASTIRKPVVTPVTELRQGGRGFIVMVPMFRGEKLAGYLAAAIRPATFIKRVVEVDDYEMTVLAGRETIFDNSSDTRAYADQWSLSIPIRLYNQEWDLRITPTVAKIRAVGSPLPYIILAIGVMLSVLFGIMAYLSIALRQQSTLMRQQRNFLDRVIHASPLPIVVLDPDARVTLWSRACESIFGWTAEEAMGNELPFVPAELREGSREFISKILASREQVHSRMQRRTKDGRPLLIRASAMSLRDEQDRVYGLMALMEDVTEQEQARIAIHEAREIAEKAARTKAEFLANMSHEIRTPLNGIIGMSDLLIDAGLQGEQRRYANIIQTSATTLLALINDILDISKIEAGKMQLEQLDFSLTALVESQADILISKAREKKLSLVTFVSPDLPRTLRGDPGRLGQVLANLISNAIKFTSAGGVSVRVFESARKPVAGGPVRLRFEVSDTGIGISDVDREKLFKPFSQVDGSTARKYGGTGLGLSISKHLVEDMGGEIGVESRPGRGSLFWFEIELNSITLNVFLETRQSERTRTLVAETDPLALDVIRRYFTAWRLPVDLASSAAEARGLIDRARASGMPYDLILSTQTVWDSGLWDRGARSGSQKILIQEFGQSMPASLGGMTGILHKPVKQSQLYDLVAGSRRQPLEEAPRDATPASVHAGAHILVADDVAANQLLTLKFLEKLGYRGHAVSNGKEVLEALSQARYDLILMDCQMPEMDGYEATRRIRNHPEIRLRRMPIVALTANAMSGDEKQCLDAGMNDYLSKPFKRERLGEIIEKWLSAAGPGSKSALG